MSGTHATADVRLTRLVAPPNADPALQPYTLLAKAQDLLRGGSRRPDNYEARYRRAHYDTRPPFCGCPT